MMVKPHQQQLSMECVLNGKTALNFPTTYTPPTFSIMTVLTTASNVLNIHAVAKPLLDLSVENQLALNTAKICVWVMVMLIWDSFGTQYQTHVIADQMHT